MIDYESKYKKLLENFTEYQNKVKEHLEILKKDKEQEISEQRMEIQALKSKLATREVQIQELQEQVNRLKPREVYKKSIENRRRYTEKEKKHMRRLYKQNGFNRTATLKQLHEENIMVSYRHLGVILNEKKGKK